MIGRLCIFCGSAAGLDPVYSTEAVNAARHLLARGTGLVYGGANIGLMGILADTMLAGGGEVIGVMPRSLVEKEVAHDRLTEMHIVEGMQERKALMADRSDAFVAMPGAFGTFDELFEVLTWNQLGIVQKPVGLFNVKGFFDPLLRMLDHSVGERFLRPEHREMLLVSGDFPDLLRRMEEYRPVTAPKWIEGLKRGEI